MDEKSLNEAVGQRVREIRMEARATQGALLDAAGALGFRWALSTVVALEAGTRALEAAELLALPGILHAATGMSVKLSDLLPPGTPVILGAAQVDSGALRALVDGQAFDAGTWAPVRSALISAAPATAAGEVGSPVITGTGAGTFAALTGAARTVDGQRAESKLAAKLAVSRADLAGVSMKVWGRSLVEERDRRVNELTDRNTPLRSLQAVRGHVMRALERELRAHLEEHREKRADSDEPNSTQ